MTIRQKEIVKYNLNAYRANLKMMTTEKWIHEEY